jgi:hypothetical protein
MPLLSIAIISALGCFVVWAFGALRTARNQVRATWNVVEASIADRAPLVTNVVDTITPHMRTDVAEQLRKAHERMGTVVGPRGTEAADTTLRSILNPALATMPTYIGIDSMKVDFANANKLIDTAAADYNEKVDGYETARMSNGRRFFAEMMGFEKESRFGRITKEVSAAPDPLTLLNSPLS